jgi:chromate transport protein ChrA
MPPVAAAVPGPKAALDGIYFTRHLYGRDEDYSRPGGTSAYVVIVVPVVVGLGFITACIVACVCYRQRKKKRQMLQQEAKEQAAVLQLRQRIYG